VRSEEGGKIKRHHRLERAARSFSLHASWLLACLCPEVLARHFLSRNYIDRTDAVFFIDPPYTAAGKKAGSRLYQHFELDHEELFEIASQLSGDFLMTYDDNDMIRSLAQRHGFDMQVISMKNTHHATMKELLIAPRLDWLRFS